MCASYVSFAPKKLKNFPLLCISTGLFGKFQISRWASPPLAVRYITITVTTNVIISHAFFG